MQRATRCQDQRRAVESDGLRSRVRRLSPRGVPGPGAVRRVVRRKRRRGVGLLARRIQRRLILRKHIATAACEDDAIERVETVEAAHGLDRDRNREPQRISICSAADGRKRDRAQPVDDRDLEATALASRQQFRLAIGAVTPYRADGMNDMRCGKAVAAGDFRVSGVAPAEAYALGEQIGPGGAMYRAVDSAASE